jgi:1,4-alpha-glucan branching enzyme
MRRENYRFGVSKTTAYREILTSEDVRYGGPGSANPEPIPVEEIPSHGMPYSIAVTIPGLSCIWIAPEKGKRGRAKSGSVTA